MLRKLSLQFKIIICQATLFILVIFSIVSINKKSIKEQVFDASKMISDAAFSGVTYPMSKGDSDSVRQVLKSFKQDLKDSEIFIFGRQKIITYSSESDKVGTDLKVTQQSAANAEELAAAAEELSAQAEQLKVYVSDMVSFISGSGNGHEMETSVAGGYGYSKGFLPSTSASVLSSVSSPVEKISAAEPRLARSYIDSCT